MKIRNDGDCYDLYGGQSFDSLLDLLTYYMSVSLRPDALALAVPTTYSTGTADTTGTAPSTLTPVCTNAEYMNASAMKGKGGEPCESESGEGPPGRLRFKSGAFVDLLYPFADVAPTAERWFHGPLSSDEAHKLLAGTLLSPPSSSYTIPPLW